MVISLKIVKIIKLQITCCLVFPFWQKIIYSIGHADRKSYLRVYLRTIPKAFDPSAVSFIDAVLHFWHEHCMHKNAKVLKTTKANYIKRVEMNVEMIN